MDSDDSCGWLAVGLNGVRAVAVVCTGEIPGVGWAPLERKAVGVVEREARGSWKRLIIFIDHQVLYL